MPSPRSYQPRNTGIAFAILNFESEACFVPDDSFRLDAIVDDVVSKVQQDASVKGPADKAILVSELRSRSLTEYGLAYGYRHTTWRMHVQASSRSLKAPYGRLCSSHSQPLSSQRRHFRRTTFVTRKASPGSACRSCAAEAASRGASALADRAFPVPCPNRPRRASASPLAPPP